MKVRCLRDEDNVFTAGSIYDVSDMGLDDNNGRIYTRFLNLEGSTFAEKLNNYWIMSNFEDYVEEEIIMKVRCLKDDDNEFTVGGVYDISDKGIKDNNGEIYTYFLNLEGDTFAEKLNNCWDMSSFEDYVEEENNMKVRCLKDDDNEFTVGEVYDISDKGIKTNSGKIYTNFLDYEGNTFAEKLNDCWFMSNFEDYVEEEIPMEYKVGDKVWIRSDLEVGTTYLTRDFTVGMKYLMGKECTVLKVVKRHGSKILSYKLKEDVENSYNWCAEMFEDRGVIHSPLAIEVKPDSFKITTENIKCYLYKDEIDISGAIFLVSEIDELIEILQLAKAKVEELD